MSGAPPMNATMNGTVPKPLSSMKAQKLDMATVERRGQPNMAPEKPRNPRLFGLPEAPTFRPTEEQFKNPIEYIKSIAEEGKRYGIVKIIPPDSWNPDLAIDTEVRSQCHYPLIDSQHIYICSLDFRCSCSFKLKVIILMHVQRFHFRTRRQELNIVEGGTNMPNAATSLDTTQTEAGTPANLNYLDQLAKFHKQRNGTNLNRFPSVDKRPLDLYKLKNLVEAQGGFDRVCKGKKWAEIGRLLGYSGKIMSSLSTSLKNSYQKWLLPFEEYLAQVKPGVRQQQEFENGGPYTPSPSRSPLKVHQHTPSSLGGDSPAVRASNALNASMQGVSPLQPVLAPERPPQLPPAASPPEPPRPSSGFTAVNSGFTAVNTGFTAVNAAPSTSAFSAINVTNGVHKTESNHATPQRSFDSPQLSASNTPNLAPSAISRSPAANPPPINTLKRTLSVEGENAVNGDSDSGRRSKRVKKDGAPTVSGSHMTQPRLGAPRALPPRGPNEKPGTRCETCGEPGDSYSLALCDGCDYGYHPQCLDPPLHAVPQSDWFCPRCLVGSGDFGFEEGGTYSLRQFQQKAQIFKDSHFATKMVYDPILNGKRPVTEEDVEREFWRLTDSLTETVEVEYGADIHSHISGSGFPTLEKNPRDPYASDPWNLNNLPLDKDSLFRQIKTDISGMTVPWLYVGMCFSCFCWHAEDHNTYSANYQHFGATKTWYGVPAEDAEKLETAMREAVPELFESNPDLLYQLTFYSPLRREITPSRQPGGLVLL